MPKNLKVVLDTNVLISALVYGGNPRKILNLIIGKNIEGVISLSIISEVLEILIQRFNFEESRAKLLEKLIRESFTITYPKKTFSLSSDPDDNKMIDAAVEGKCHYIISGDHHLLDLGSVNNIKILNPSQFLEETN